MHTGGTALQAVGSTNAKAFAFYQDGRVPVQEGPDLTQVFLGSLWLRGWGGLRYVWGAGGRGRQIGRTEVEGPEKRLL